MQLANNLIRKIFNRISKLFPKRLYGIDLRYKKGGLLQKKALLSYIVHPFSISRDNPRYYRHINIWRAPEIVRILNELGYLVDVVDYTDEKFIPPKKYDLFIGHGGFNFENIAGHLDESTTKIYFTTGNYWKFRNEVNSVRLSALRKRKGFELLPDRLQIHKEEGALLIADGVIGIGSDFSRNTYKNFSPVIMINVTALFDDYYECQNKDFKKGKEHFLYFAGQGNVHKGLDLLLDAFIELEQHLWICSYIDKQFAEIYSEELHNYPNIHLVGWIQPRSPRFYEMMDFCNYVILPSCSEGQPHSVVECMNQGLIPIVSEACGLKINGYGEILDPCTVEGIKKAVLKFTAFPSAQCKEMSAKARKIAQGDFSEDAFHGNMKNALLQLTASPRPRKQMSSNQISVDSVFVDEHHNVSYHDNVLSQIQKKSDIGYFKHGQGIVEVDQGRWEESQRYERRAWMEAGGLKAREDRNLAHKNGFENYSVIKGNYFRSVIELGCGPFTNMRHIVKNIWCQKITLLDPLINDYLTHPNCAYKNKRLGGWFGKKVETIALPIEEFSPEEKFDFVVMINVLEHCFSALKIFECISSITAPNGIIVFHDKLIPDNMIDELVRKVYDTGHPLRIAESIVLNFLYNNYHELFRKHIPIKTTYGMLDSIYFIGRKRD